MRSALCLLLLAPILLTQTGCSTVAYYSQSVQGQLELLSRREAITDRLQDPDLSAMERDRLDLVLQLKAFATRELDLPDTGSYSDIARLDDDYVVWNVVATPEFSLQPEQWCFPVAGCLSYRGYFNKHDAEQFAQELRAQGFDVFIGGVAAYSTLGWFDDPVLSPMLQWSEARFVEVILHELSHQKLYVRGDTAFNEAYATAVGQIGMRIWLHRHASNNALIALYQQQAYDADFTRLLLDTRQRLASLYEQDVTADRMRTTKARLLKQMQSTHQQLRLQHPQADHYDQWFRQETSNARLALVNTYHGLTAAFHTLFLLSLGDWSDFHARAAQLGALPPAIRSACLQRLHHSDTTLGSLIVADCLDAGV